MSAVSDDVATALKYLPKDSALEDVQDGLYVLEKIKRGLEDVEAGRTLTQHEVEKRLAKWLNADLVGGGCCRQDSGTDPQSVAPPPLFTGYHRVIG
jgi:predicted transcriptional regulator